MVDAFLQSIFVQPRKVLGRQLQHFSAFHAAALAILKSPYWFGKTVGTDDLIIAVYVCTLTHPTGAARLFPSPPLETITEWGEQAARLDVAEEAAAFTVYLDDYLRLPKLTAGEGGYGSQVPVPFLCVSTILRHMGGITRSEAWNMPFSELLGYHSEIAESLGAKVIATKALEALENIEKALAKNGDS